MATLHRFQCHCDRGIGKDGKGCSFSTTRYIDTDGTLMEDAPVETDEYEGFCGRCTESWIAFLNTHPEGNKDLQGKQSPIIMLPGELGEWV